MDSLVKLASPEQGNARFLTFYYLTLPPNESVTMATQGHEHVLDVLSGACHVVVEDAEQRKIELGPVGKRADIFSGMPEFVYVPRSCSYTVHGLESVCQVGIYSAPTGKPGTPVYILQDQVKALVSGASNWKRNVYIGLGGEGPATAMMVGETHSPPGNWSGFPPHRHSFDQLPSEAQMEELYFFQFDPPSGFAIGGVYEDINNREGTARLSLVRHNQLFDVPGGYHFIAPCPGYQLNYIWALGGPRCAFGAWVTDPDYAWLANYKE